MTTETGGLEPAMTEEPEIEFLRRERDMALRMHQVQFERANQLEMLAAGNAAGLRYWNRRYVETAQQHAVDIAAKDALRAQRQAVLDLCDEADRNAMPMPSDARDMPAVTTPSLRAALGADPVTTEQPTPDGPPDELIKAATDAASREHYAGFVAAQFAVGVNDPVPYDQLSERTRRIRENQMRGLATAALAASWPLLRAQIADELRAFATRAEEQRTGYIDSLTRRNRGTQVADPPAQEFISGVRSAAERVARGGTDA